jgi:hypothetical protein
VESHFILQQECKEGLLPGSIVVTQFGVVKESHQPGNQALILSSFTQQFRPSMNTNIVLITNLIDINTCIEIH